MSGETPVQGNIEVLNDWKVPAETRLRVLRSLKGSFLQDLSTVCEVDLHLHTFCSDGYRSPAGVVFEAWRRRMRAIAVTDHDNFDGCREAVSAGSILGVDVIPGTEFYTDRPGVEIIAWWPLTDEFDAWFRRDGGKGVVEPIRSAKQKQLRAMMARVPSCMAKRGFDAEIAEVDIDRYVRNGVSTKGDISVIMWQKYGPQLACRGIAVDVKDFQAKYTTQDDELNVPLELDMDLSATAFVHRILAWGGLPGLSHPTELRKKEGLGNDALYELIAKLGEEGLQAVEVDGWRNGRDPETGLNQTDVFVEMVERYNNEFPGRLPLLMTNGSDDHNQPGEGLEMGSGRDRNMRPGYGTYERVDALRERAVLLAGRRGIERK